jgi:hypothetical protein
MSLAPSGSRGIRAGTRVSRTAALTFTMTLMSPHARAADPAAACAGTRITVDDRLGARWLEPVAHLCEQYAAMKDVDPAARLHIMPAGEEVDIEASLGDARVTHRRVHSPDDLLTVVEALTMAIPDVRSEQGAGGGRPAPAVVPPTPATNSRPPERFDQRAVQTPPKVAPTRGAGAGLGVELGVALEGRLSGSPAYLSLGGAVYAALRPEEWFFGLVARWQPSEVPASAPQPGIEIESAGAGFVVARRVVKTRTVGIDTGASTLVLVDTLSTETRTPDEVGTDTQVRFGLLVRALIGGGNWKFASSLDADVAPARLGSIHVDPALPPLPAWSVALALGAAWTEP